VKVPAAAIVLVERDNGRTIELGVGDTVLLRLPENATTGYRWALDCVDPDLLCGHEARYFGHAAAVGSGGIVEWQLDVKAPGTAAVRLKLWRHWEGETSVKGRFAVTLRIKP
jgi:inhibitor of cysteine peptidase